MKQEWRQNVVLARSKIQGLGLYAARDLEKHQMIIEYIGEVIRSDLTDIREKRYEDQNRGIYMSISCGETENYYEMSFLLQVSPVFVELRE